MKALMSWVMSKCSSNPAAADTFEAPTLHPLLPDFPTPIIPTSHSNSHPNTHTHTHTHTHHPQVFCATGDPAQEEMRSACFDYLSLGGIYSSGPISLLSGLNPSPLALVMHFFMVALYGVGRLVLPRPTLRGLWMSIALLVNASQIILPILWSEGVRAVFFPGLAPKPLKGIKSVEKSLSRTMSSKSFTYGA